MDFPIRKDYQIELKIKSFFGTKYTSLRYKQASLSEILYFLQNSDDITKYYLYFIGKYGDLKYKKEYLKNFQSVWENIEKTFFKGLFDKKEVKKQSYIPFSSTLLIICKETGETPQDFIENYTLDQMNYIIEGIIYNQNEQTKEGQKKNKSYNKKKEYDNLSTEKKDKINSLLDKIPD